MAIPEVTSRTEVVRFLLACLQPALPGYSLVVAPDHSHVRATRRHGEWLEAGLSFAIVTESTAKFYVTCVVRPLFVPGDFYLSVSDEGSHTLGSAWPMDAKEEKVAAALRRWLARGPACLSGPATLAEFIRLASIDEKDVIEHWDGLGEAVAYAHLLSGAPGECVRLLRRLVEGIDNELVDPDVHSRARQMLGDMQKDRDRAYARLREWRDSAAAQLALLPTV